MLIFFLILICPLKKRISIANFLDFQKRTLPADIAIKVMYHGLKRELSILKIFWDVTYPVQSSLWRQDTKERPYRKNFPDNLKSAFWMINLTHSETQLWHFLQNWGTLTDFQKEQWRLCPPPSSARTQHNHCILRTKGHNFSM